MSDRRRVARHISDARGQSGSLSCLPVSGSCGEVSQGRSGSDHNQPVLGRPGEPDHGDPPLPGHYRPRQQLGGELSHVRSELNLTFTLCLCVSNS